MRTLLILDCYTNTKQQTSETVSYIFPIDNWRDVQESNFQLAKKLKMNINKHIWINYST